LRKSGGAGRLRLSIEEHLDLWCNACVAFIMATMIASHRILLSKQLSRNAAGRNNFSALQPSHPNDEQIEIEKQIDLSTVSNVLPRIVSIADAPGFAALSGS